MAVSIYNSEHKLFVTALWNKEISCANIADALNENYGLNATRLGIIGLARRLGLDARGPSGKFRQDGAKRRLATMAERGTKPGPQPKKAAQAIPAPSDEPTPIGAINEHADSGCRWIHGDVQVKFQFCAHAQTEHSPYCAFHAVRSKGQQPRPIQPGVFRSDRIR